MTTIEKAVRRKLGGQFRNLVFEGGGVWGIAYEGVLDELRHFGLMDAVRRVAGASAGAITASLLATGHTAADLGRILRETDFSQFTDDTTGIVRDAKRVVKQYGLYRGKEFVKWLRAHVRLRTRQVSKELGVKAPPADPTFRELRAWQRRLAAAGGPRLPELFLVGSNLSDQRREIYSADHSPQLRITSGARASMSIPLFFACARNSERDVLVDGGLTWNFPVNLFDSTKYLDKSSNGKPISYARRPSHVFNTETLGFRLDTTEELRLNLQDWANRPMKITNLGRYAWALFAFIRAVANKVHLHKNDWSRTVFVDVGEKISFIDFDLSQGDMNFLSERGRQGVRNYLTWRVSQKGVEELRRIYADMK